MKKKVVVSGLAGIGLGYSLWRGWEAAMEKAWTKAFGPCDLGPADFDTLQRRSRPSDALASPKAVTPRANPDFEPPVFQISPDRLRALVGDLAAAETDTTMVFADPSKRQDRYVARTRLMRFPDTVDVRVLDLGEGRSTLAIYSRSQVASSNFGVNRKRLKRWVERVAELVARESDASAP